MRRITLALLTTCLLCACGQKGNLYLPDSQPEAIPAASPADAGSAAAAAPAAAPAAAASTTPDERDAAARNKRSN